MGKLYGIGIISHEAYFQHYIWRQCFSCHFEGMTTMRRMKRVRDRRLVTSKAGHRMVCIPGSIHTGWSSVYSRNSSDADFPYWHDLSQHWKWHHGGGDTLIMALSTPVTVLAGWLVACFVLWFLHPLLLISSTGKKKRSKQNDKFENIPWSCHHRSLKKDLNIRMMQIL